MGNRFALYKKVLDLEKSRIDLPGKVYILYIG